MLNKTRSPACQNERGYAVVVVAAPRFDLILFLAVYRSLSRFVFRNSRNFSAITDNCAQFCGISLTILVVRSPWGVCARVLVGVVVEGASCVK